jgi:hypothetical protein
MSEFNAHIVGPIQIEAVFTGEQFAEEIDASTKLPRELLAQFGAPQ